MFISKIRNQKAICKCCNGDAELYGKCDFSKNCEELKGKYIKPMGIPIYYYKCSSCGFIFSTQFDNASHDEFKKYIYNDQYVLVDPDFVEKRPNATSMFVWNNFLQYDNKIRLLDYGGGNGELERKLKERGFTNIETYDPFYEKYSIRPDGKFNLILCFEVIEHVPKPYETFKDILSFLDDSEGLILFSTLTQPSDIDKYKIDWWYIAPRNGHISIHTKKSLETVLKKLNLKIHSIDRDMHFAFREVPKFIQWHKERRDRIDDMNTNIINQGAKYLELGDITRALKAFNDVLENDPINQDAHLNIAVSARQKGNSVLALRHLKRLLELNPYYAGAYNLSGIIFFKSGDLENAKRLFATAIKKDPTLIEAQRNYGEVLLALEDYESGVNTFVEILKKHPDDVPSLLRMAQLYTEVGRDEEARQYAAKVLEYDPENKWAKGLVMDKSLRLNLGCGNNPIAGYVNVDKFGNQDVKHDLEIFPWPWETNSVEKVNLIHVLEHLGESTEIYFKIIKELYRICKSGALIYIVVLHPRSDGFISDPTHVRPINPASIELFSKSKNAEWAEKNWPNSPLGMYLDVNLEIVNVKNILNPYFNNEITKKNISKKDIEKSFMLYNNVIQDIEMTVKVVK